MIIDSHCHLNYEPMSLSLKETIERANRDGVKYLLTISTEDKSYDKILNIISNNECVFGSYGIHPHEAKNHQLIKSEDIIKKFDEEGSPYYATARLWDDGVIDPLETRSILGNSLSFSQNLINKKSNFGVFRM